MLLSLGGGWSGASLSEAVLQLSGDSFQVLHSSSALSSSSLGLGSPIVSTDFAGRRASGGVSFLLLVPVLFSTESRERVGFVSPLTLSLGSFCH